MDPHAQLVAVPVLVGALVRARRGSARAELLAACALAYAVYHYAIYVFGTAFNALFLAHVALLGLAAVALVLALRSLDVRDLAARLHPRTPVRRVSGLLAFLAVALGGMWTYYALRFAATGAAPAESKLVLPMSAVHLGYALDLLLLVPGYAHGIGAAVAARPLGLRAGHRAARLRGRQPARLHDRPAVPGGRRRARSHHARPRRAVHRNGHAGGSGRPVGRSPTDRGAGRRPSPHRGAVVSPSR